MMGHAVGTLADELASADVVEVWGEAQPGTAATAATAHLVRPGRHAAFPAPDGAVLHIPPVLERDDADRLLDQLLAADRVVVW
jgi:hypothetical protein